MNDAIAILISTSNQRLQQIRIEKDEGIRYIIIHQYYNHQPFKQCPEIDAQSVYYKLLDSSGISKSRNAALTLCKFQYAYFMDDDVSFNVRNIKKLVERMKLDNVDVATCQFIYPNGSFPKPYRRTPFNHDMFSVGRVASIEICINMASINRHNIRFDERFGLGTDLPSGEEYIFLTDCIKAGLTVRYYPIVTGIHPYGTSGLDFYTSPSRTIAKREMIKRVFSRQSICYIIVFWLKKLPIVMKSGYFWQFTRFMLLGTKK